MAISDIFGTVIKPAAAIRPVQKAKPVGSAQQQSSEQANTTEAAPTADSPGSGGQGEDDGSQMGGNIDVTA